MSLRKYLAAISPESFGAASETALYTPLATQLFADVLGYSTKHYAINKTGEKGTPDIRLFSGDDVSEWVVCEAKLNDGDIRKEKNRSRIWQEQILGHGYITAETVYVILCAPRTFYVCDLSGKVLDAIHIERDALVEINSGTHLALTDANLRSLLTRVTFEESLKRPQYEQFRAGALTGGHIPLSSGTLGYLQEVFEFSLRTLKTYCATEFERLKGEHQTVAERLTQLQQEFENAGADLKWRSRVQSDERALRKRYRTVLQLFEVEYPQFRHDQTYSGTDKEENFEDIFTTNTAYVALSRLFFVRICEDIGLTSRKISHEGPGIWRRFVEHIKSRYQDLLDVAYKDVSHVYPKLFETTVFDWYGLGNGRLNLILEQILFRLNAFSFKDVNRDLLGTIYQYFRPKAERKRLGEYYTPEYVADYILNHVGFTNDPDILTKHILDPACGSFTFGVRSLLPIVKAGRRLSAENKLGAIQQSLTGYDINPFSVFLAHLSVLFATLDFYLQAKRDNSSYEMPGFAIDNRNSLTYVSTQAMQHLAAADSNEVMEGTFDYVVGNPPFVRNERLPEDDRQALDALYADLRSGNTDLSSYFLYYAMRYSLRENGILGMVAPISAANTDAAERLRSYLQRFEILQVVSLEWMAKQVFPDADIIPMLIFVRKTARSGGHKVTIVSRFRNRSELVAATTNKDAFGAHATEMDCDQWLQLSPTGGWPLEVTVEDIPILGELRKKATLGTVARCLYAVKQGGASVIRAGERPPSKETFVPFVGGQHVCAYGVSDAEERIDLGTIQHASGGSIWRDLNFYRDNAGCEDQVGIGRTDYRTRLLIDHAPSDILCCVVPEVYVTIVASAINPLHLCANNSVVVVVPMRFSAPVIAAIMNSRISRYYAWLLLRSGILLRRRAHWYPRALANLPMPNLDRRDAERLHALSVEAAKLSATTHLNEVETFIDLMANCSDLTKAGMLRLDFPSGDGFLDKDDVVAGQVHGGKLRLGETEISGDEASLFLMRMALLALEKDEIRLSELQNVTLPRERSERQEMYQQISGLAHQLTQTATRVNAIGLEIDQIVAGGLGLPANGLEVISRRCEEFPLSATVNRPRYLWSPDRKRQLRRVYKAGQRFR